MIEFRSVSKTFPDGTHAVDGFSLVIPAHRTTVLVGSSGSGKTTLLRMINRMVEPTGGTVEIDGESVREKDPVALRRSIGYVMQNSGLMPHFTVIDNVATVLRLNGVARGAAHARARELLDTVGLDQALAERYPSQLSGGQQQRVGVARGLAADPNILLMDEPCSAVSGIVRFMSQPSRITGTMITYGFAGHNGQVLADTPVFEQISDGSWVRLPWYWTSNAMRENGTRPFTILLGQGMFRFGYQQPVSGGYTGNDPVTGKWWGGSGEFDTAADLRMYYAGTWSEECGSVHPASVRFTDVPADYSFLKEISWMASKGITTGYAGECGTKSFNPWGNVTRDAMAAFLYRYAGSPAVTLPDSSPFVDVDPSHPFYKEIVWLSTQGITNGWETPSGTEYRPSQPITRDAMAAFLYRYAGKPATTPPDTSPFADVATDNPFYNEITWLAEAGISTGWSTAGGKEYRPYNNITRDAMAAFLYRYDSKH